MNVIIRTLAVGLGLFLSIAIAQNVQIQIQNYSENTAEIWLENDAALAGFQIDIIANPDNVTLINVFGGRVGDSDFIVDFSGFGRILAFSFTGADIPAGSGPLCYVDLEFAGDPGILNLTNTVFALDGGGGFQVEVGPPLVINGPLTAGCTSSQACNYNPWASEDDGSCEYESCVDCMGVPNGTAYVDNCGICSAGTSGHMPNSDQNICGMCFAENDDCIVELFWGELNHDEQVIELWITTPMELRQIAVHFTGADFDYVVGGALLNLDWQVEINQWNYLEALSLDSPNYLPVGTYMVALLSYTGISDSEICIGAEGPTYIYSSDNDQLVLEPGPCFDFGDILMQGCTDPAACNYNPYAEEDNGSCDYSCFEDCAGVFEGEAFVNECGCVGGTTGLAPDWCIGCTDSEALNFNPEANIDDGSCIYPQPIQFSIDLSAEINGNITIWIHNPGPDLVGHFRFWMSGIDLNGVTGGVIDEFGFDVFESDDNMVRGEHTGQLIPPGDFQLITLQFTEYVGTSICLFINQITSPITGELLYEAGPCADLQYVVQGCTDPEACTFDPDANLDDGTCQYLDCLGVCGGDALIDDCGQCSNYSDEFQYNWAMDCNGVCFGDAVLDDCGVCSGGDTGLEPNADMDACGICFGPNQEIYLDCGGDECGSAFLNDCGYCVGGNTGADENTGLDCLGVCDGDAIIDDCGICFSPSSNPQPEWIPNSCDGPMEAGVCSGSWTGEDFDDCGVCFGGNAAMDCTGTCFGEAVLDDCSICSGGTSGHAFDSDMDCNGDCFGSAYIEGCGMCVGGLTGHEPNTFIDCAGVCFGQAFVDFCGDCVGGTTGLQPCNLDCAGINDGIAFVDDCGMCVGGTTGLEPNFAMDDCGICFGSNADLDCMGLCFGQAIENECGCVGGSSGLEPLFCYGCPDPIAMNFDPDAIIDDGTCSYYEIATLFFGEVDYQAQNFEIWVDTAGESIRGFQFVLNGIDISDVYGGAVEDANYNVSFSTSMILGFTFSWDSLPVGQYHLLTVQYSAVTDDFVSISDVIFSVAGGGGIAAGVGEPLPIFLPLNCCPDPESCNFDPSCLPDDDSFCIYPDCSGECGGTAFLDACGICVGGSTGLLPCDCGCTDPDALNYNPDASVDDGSCFYSQQISVSIEQVDLLNQTLEIWVDNPGPYGIYGFQFALIGLVVDEVIGGLALNMDYVIQIGQANNVVLGISLVNAELPPGNFALVELHFADLDGSEICITEPVFSGPPGATSLDVVIGPCVPVDLNAIWGCTDPAACNHNPDATADDGSCLYLDCNDECGGSAFVDTCGICAGGSTGLVPNADLDCTGICFGAADLDECGICCGGDSGVECSYYNSEDDYGGGYDCCGYCMDGGSGDCFIDDCGECYVPWSGLEPNWAMDCAGECFGSAFEDDCGECVGGSTGFEANWAMDCTGNCWGDALVDDCGICSAGSSGHPFNSDLDCAGDCFGEAFLDDCDICSGGTSNHEADSDQDACGICFGSFDEPGEDCNGDFCGLATINECGYCTGGNSGLPEDEGMDCAGTCFGEAFLDDCGVCSGGSSGHQANSDMDCAGDCFGEAFLDDCGICTGGNTGHEANTDQDCCGTCFGGAFIDDCGECVGGTTGFEPNWAMDCNGDCHGAAFENECGCVAGGTGLEPTFCYGCTNPECLNYDPNVIFDDGSCVYPPEIFYTFNQSQFQAFYFFELATITGTELQPGDYIAAFNGEICVGAGPWSGPFTSISVYGDDGSPATAGYLTAGEIPSWQFFSAATAEYYPAQPNGEFPWANNAMHNVSHLAAGLDCAGVWDGFALFDDCGVCSGGTTGHEANSDMDCAGTCFGEAYLNDCGYCISGTTGMDDSWGLETYCFDSDGDGLGNPSTASEFCDCSVPEGWVLDCTDEFDDGEISLTLNVEILGDSLVIEILYDSDVNIYGYQYNVQGATLLSGYDPVHGFMISVTPDGGVIGFNFGGFYFPAGTGILTTLTAEINPDSGIICLTDLILSGPPGTLPEVIVEDCWTWPDNMDCSGVYDGEAVIDDCGMCVGGSTGLPYNWAMDCIGDCWDDMPPPDDRDGDGDIFWAYLNMCGICVGGNTGLPENTGLDCAGECFGEAFIDDCGFCSGGTSGHDPNMDMDCAGDCFGEAYENECGCVGGSTQLDPDVCYGCPEPGALNFDPDALYDDGSCAFQNWLWFDAGSNLVSFPLQLFETDLADVFAPLQGQISGIIGEGVAAMPNPNNANQWLGSLSSLSPEDGYWIIMEEGAMLEIVSGGWIEQDMSYSLHAGANLISFPSGSPQSIASAVPYEFLPLLNGIIGAGVAAIPHPIVPGALVGSLDTVYPFHGYWFLFNQDVDFFWNLDLLVRPEIVTDAPVDALPASLGFTQSARQAFYFIESLTVPNLEQLGEVFLVASCNGIPAGTRRWQGSFTDVPVMGRDEQSSTEGYCLPGNVPAFELVVSSNGQHIPLQGNIPCWQDLQLNTINLTAVDPVQPQAAVLVEAFPNPFNPVTQIRYHLLENGQVHLDILDVQGRQVINLVDQVQSAGVHTLSWNAQNMAAGIYLVRLETDNKQVIAKLMLLK